MCSNVFVTETGHETGWVIPTVQVTSAGGRNQGGFPRFAQFRDAEVNRKKKGHNILSINIPTVPVKKKLKYRTVGAVAVRWRCGGGAVAVRYLYARGTLEVRSRYAGSTLKVRSRYARSTLEGTLEQGSVPSKCALESRP